MRVSINRLRKTTPNVVLHGQWTSCAIRFCKASNTPLRTTPNPKPHSGCRIEQILLQCACAHDVSYPALITWMWQTASNASLDKPSIHRPDHHSTHTYNIPTAQRAYQKERQGSHAPVVSATIHQLMPTLFLRNANRI